MKRLLSCILCISLIMSVIIVPVGATDAVVFKENAKEFCSDMIDLISEYGDTEYITPDKSVLESEADYGVENSDINYCSRLIVQSDKPVKKYGAVDVVSGFSNFYIVQFENEEDTNNAYEKYSADEDVLSVSYDVSYSGLKISADGFEDESVTYEDYLDSWYLESTGMDIILEKYENEDLPQVIIGVVDSGYDFNNTYLGDRIIETNFNNAQDGDEGSEQDYDGHGTKLTSVIANCTTDNVRIAHYRCANESGVIESMALAATAILAAVDGGADVVNCSFYARGAYELFEEVIDYAYDRSCVIINSASGSYDIEYSYYSALSRSPKTVTVGSSGTDDSYYSGAWGECVDVLAPGEDIPVCGLNNTFSTARGESISSAFMAAVYAMYSSTHLSMSFADKIRAIKSCGDKITEPYTNTMHNSGVVNVLKLFEIETLEAPTFSHNERQYNGEVSLELFAEEGADIYFTTDGTFPSPSRGTLYTEPYTFVNSDLKIRAVAYKDGKRSNCVSKNIASMVIGTDDMFTVTEDGVITGYSGDVAYLKIPEYINGIKIVDLKYGAFQSEALKGVVLPDTVEYLGWTDNYFDRVITGDDQIGCFNDCTYLEYIWGYNVKALGYYALQGFSYIKEMFFPECEEIYPRAFYWCTFTGINFPKVKRVGYRAFEQNHHLREVYLPECEEISYGAFDMTTHTRGASSDIKIFYAPKANFMADVIFYDEEHYTVDSPDATESIFKGFENMSCLDLLSMETFGTDAFSGSAIKRLELSSAKYLYSLPNILSLVTDKPIYTEYDLPVTVELCLPSTLKYCVPTTDYVHDNMSYVVYGTAGVNSYAEQWATANKVPFYEISQETAVVEDIETVWDKYSYRPLEFDARGFNRTYQWYGSSDNVQGDSDDKLIVNATEKTFDPGEFKPYQYYYCIMTSTDKNEKGETVSEVEIKSSMCQNRLYHMYGNEGTYIDFDEKLIFTTIKEQTDITGILNFTDEADYRGRPSYVYRDLYIYGTDSAVVLYTDGPRSDEYIVILQGDVNGDGAVDVIDLAGMQNAVNNQGEFEGYYYLAADIDRNNQVDIVDYSQAVNMALAG